MDKNIVIPPGQDLPSQAAWDEMVRAADRLQILEGGTLHVLVKGRIVGKPVGTTVLFESSQPEELESLRACVRIRSDANGVSCMCMGELAFVFLRGEDRLAVLGFHHGESFRWDRWFGDGPLLENEGILNWLSERGMRGPALEVAVVKRRRALKKMYAATPACLATVQRMLDRRAYQALGVLSFEIQNRPSPFRGEVELLQQKCPLELLQQMLEESHPNPHEQALLLFRWYGHFSGSWNSLPPFEAEPATLLLHMPLDVLIQALERGELSPEELEGVAHLLGSSQFATRFGPAWKCVPEPLIQRLLEHAVPTINKDIALKAFLPQK